MSFFQKKQHQTIRRIVEALSQNILILPEGYKEPEIEVPLELKQQMQVLQEQFKDGQIDFIEYCSQVEALVQASGLGEQQ